MTPEQAERLIAAIDELNGNIQELTSAVESVAEAIDGKEIE